MRSRIAALALVLCFLPRAMAEGLPDLGEAAQSEFSPAQERRLGENIVRDFRARDPAYLDDPEVEDYLNRLGNKLVAHSQAARQQFEFFAVRDSTLNAFALPGGYIGVHTGLVTTAQTESELASVLSHEIAHVTQHHIARMVSTQGQTGMMALAALLVAVLAARSNAQVGEAAMAAGQAAAIQTQLGYSRDFEREADRFGLQTLEAAGFDTRGMSSFFERLQQQNRLYENNAPVYVRTHPLTTERITDIGNRVQGSRYRQVADNPEFNLIRAKLLSQQGRPDEAVARLQTGGGKGSPAFQGSALAYGLAHAYARGHKWAEAERELAKLPRGNPLFESLAAEIRSGQGDLAGAARIYKDALARTPHARALVYGYAEVLLQAGGAKEAQPFLQAEIQYRNRDPRLHGLQARAYAALGKRTQQHRAQAEVYALRGNTMAAVEQLQLAQRAGDADFYELSAVDARLRELQARAREELKERNAGR